MTQVELLARNPHPGIPQLLDQGWWHASAEVAHPYFAMEWIRGRPLYEWARRHNPTPAQVSLQLAQLAGVLAVLQAQQCVHRDVKGDNILVRLKDGREIPASLVVMAVGIRPNTALARDAGAEGQEAAERVGR